MKTAIAVLFAAALGALGACTAPVSEPETQTLEQIGPPPELETLTADGLSAAEAPEALSEEQAGDSGAQVKQRDVEFLPGLSEASGNTVDPVTGEKQLPFEQSLERRQKRIYLGLDNESESDQPVNNVLDIEF